MALVFLRQPVFALAVYLHAMTFVFLGMFVASSAGEILFNKEEADILLHRPVTSRGDAVGKNPRAGRGVALAGRGHSIWSACSSGLARRATGDFPMVHLFSTALEALFCTGCVVLVYQLCLRWFGRERLEGLMTTAQVLVSVAAVMSGQILPRLVFRLDHVLNVGESSWWIGLLPPAWFAGLDDALAGSAHAQFLAAGRAGGDGHRRWCCGSPSANWRASYETGLQALNETVSTAGQKAEPPPLAGPAGQRAAA